MFAKLLLKLYNKISIKTKLLVTVTLFALCPIFIIGYFGYRSYSNALMEKSISHSQNTVHELSVLLTERIQKINTFSIQMFYDSTIYNYYASLISTGYDDFRYLALQDYLHSLLISKDELSEILLRFTRYGYVCIADRTYLAKPDSIKYIDALYAAAKKGDGKPVWYIAMEGKEFKGIYLTRIIYSLQTRSTELGLLVIKVKEEYFFELFNNLMSNSGQNLNVFTSDNTELFKYQSFNENPDASLNSVSPNKVSKIKLTDDDLYLISSDIKPLEWKLVLSISSKILFKEIKDKSRTIILLCIGAIVICLFLLNYVYIDIIRPMNLLIKKMHQIENGDLGTTIKVERLDEIGYVFRTFNSMSQQIKNLINRVFKEQIAMKNAEIKALQAQINPHFLYNTLEAIKWKAKINGDEEVCEMVAALSSITEANLNRNNEKIILIYKEIEYIDNYYLLIQKRFGKRISFKKDIHPGILNYKIPKLIIQPLIENAVYHGLECKKGGGCVTLTIKTDSDNLYIIVSDDGIGIEEKILTKLQSALSEQIGLNDESAIDSNANIGIMNVHRRIRLLYGDNFGLKLSSSFNSGTTVTLNLPIDEVNGV